MIAQVICQLRRADNIMFLSAELGRDFDVMVTLLCHIAEGLRVTSIIITAALCDGKM